MPTSTAADDQTSAWAVASDSLMWERHFAGCSRGFRAKCGRCDDADHGVGLDMDADAARWNVAVGDGGTPAGAGRGVRAVAAPAGWRDQRLRPVARSRGRAPGAGSAGVGPGPRDG